MKIRTKLSVLFTVLTAAILLVFASLVYYSAYQNRENEFFKRLHQETITKANLFFAAKVDAHTLQTIYKNNMETINEVQVAIYDTNSNLLYHDAADIDAVKETRQMMKTIMNHKYIRFYQGDWQAVGLLFTFDNNKYIITASAYDKYGYSKLRYLRETILFMFICSILVIYAAGRFFSKRALQPVTEIVDKVKNITASNLDLRLDNAGGKDELAELASTFNGVLDRIENSFEAQKQFVSNISHEVRTPLAVLTAELELSTYKERSVAEYKKVITNTLIDARRLSKLSDSLLDFAKASYDPSEISFKEVRIDEILLDARQKVQKENPGYQIDIHYEREFETDSEISVVGNEYLLNVAFANLLENGGKFSKNPETTVEIIFKEEKIILMFSDNGIGISKEDLKLIFTPFFRGNNKKFAEGNGVGLSLTQKIIALHKGTILVSSEIDKGTIFTIELPHL
ncbi:HAMP domain-containing sensor histidine kinase [Dyadobacter sp. CY356]|uniref:sensor histidine kinase n=1 Tax=Dyadobacter sp. CY356 TaxID=2906442 RepID=UPI001F1D70CE|nr:HAMP domain-containing sensor histidine kinase [Dyadobacter sp. CY356]MCF0055461.1 HAMP domain-containing histidine kinase [Dyadobacter sp. CY356]